jgi:hypothetical protein
VALKTRWNPLLLTLLVVALCVGAYLGVRAWRERADPSLRAHLSRIIPDSDLVLYVDIAALRRAGLAGFLEGNAAVEEPEYRHFVTESGFDWTSDLDEVVAAQVRGSWHMLARGRFDWSKINAYMTARGAQCKNAVCDMPASTPGRRISMFPVSSSVMALASSQNHFEVYYLMRSGSSWLTPPPGPVWISLPASTLTKALELPAGSRLFAKALEGASRITVSLGVASSSPEVLLVAECRDPATAASLSSQLSGVTTEFRKYFERLGQQPNAGDLSGLLLAGQFATDGRIVTGRWPVAQLFLENLFGGKL